MKTSWATPAAILIGCGVIAVTLHFTLRAPGPAQRPATEAGASAARAAPAAPDAAAGPSGAQPGVTASAAPLDRDAVKLAAERALAQEKAATFVPRCWQPLVARAAEPATAAYTFDVTFDAGGNEIGRGISERRGASRPDVAQCLRELPIGLTVPPPGAPVQLELELRFP
jgi:hypothetical protein